MYNFSGIIYQICACYLFILLLGVLCLLLEKPWSKGFKLKKCIVELFMILFAICMILIHMYRIYYPDVSSYTGKFVDTHRVSVARPLPFTNEYVFWNGEGKKQPFYLDTFSKKKIFPYSELDSDKEYIVYYDDFSNVIVKIEECE